ncbi:DUF4276 family protein [Kutzneria chonburiensis]|uniref:DUF4276 family protein n=1 Tax=Kutzneria chonburiensis TaxID=1483604 RepID=A0ABV6MW04_9PSEU|nr:DUF4276 family protein [Kutzneria chonburiensis]
MSLPIVVPVVEGHGETTAVRVLLDRIGWELGWPHSVAQPFRVPRTDLADPVKLSAAVAVASRNVPGAGGVLVLFDADDDCPVELNAKLQDAAGNARCGVEIVAANREFEAWFLASVASLRLHAAVKSDAIYATDPEQRRGAKEQLSQLMVTPYREVRHQPAFASLIDLETTWRKSRSFRRLLSALQRLLEVEALPWTL